MRARDSISRDRCLSDLSLTLIIVVLFIIVHVTLRCCRRAVFCLVEKASHTYTHTHSSHIGPRLTITITISEKHRGVIRLLKADLTPHSRETRASSTQVPYLISGQREQRFDSNK